MEYYGILWNTMEYGNVNGIIFLTLLLSNYGINVSTCSSIDLQMLLGIYGTDIFICILFLSVCLYPINVITAEPIVPKFCEGPNGPRKGF